MLPQLAVTPHTRENVCLSICTKGMSQIPKSLELHHTSTLHSSESNVFIEMKTKKGQISDKSLKAHMALKINDEICSAITKDSYLSKGTLSQIKESSEFSVLNPYLSI